MDDLSEFLANIDRDNAYTVLETLKTSKNTRIEKVSKDEHIFVRKYYLKDQNKTNELGILSRLHHEALPQIYHSYELADRRVIIEEFIEGISLFDYVKQNEKLFSYEAVMLTSQLCEIVAFLHGQNPPIIHRDIKPDNIIYTKNGIKLIDFNIARTYNPRKGRDTVFMGTVGYAPPEQFGFGQTDRRSDIYAIGKTFLFMLTGAEPEHNYDERIKILPSFLQRIIYISTGFAPQSRYGSAGQMMQDLRAARDQIRAENFSNRAANDQIKAANGRMPLLVMTTQSKQRKNKPKLIKILRQLLLMLLHLMALGISISFIGEIRNIRTGFSLQDDIISIIVRLSIPLAICVGYLVGYNVFRLPDRISFLREHKPFLSKYKPWLIIIMFILLVALEWLFVQFIQLFHTTSFNESLL